MTETMKTQDEYQAGYIVDVLRRHIRPWCSVMDGTELPSEDQLRYSLTRAMTSGKAFSEEWTIDAMGYRDWNLDYRKTPDGFNVSLRYRGDNQEAAAAAHRCNSELHDTFKPER